MTRAYIIDDEAVEAKAADFDWLKMADEWGRTLRTSRGNDHWRAQFRAVGECLPWPGDHPVEMLELCPGSGLITEVLLEAYPNLIPSLMEVQPIFRRIARENIRARSGRDPDLFAADLRDQDWWRAIDRGRFDLVVVSDALNGLTPKTLCNVYAGVRRLLKPGGLFFNFDRVAADCPAIQRMYDRVRQDVFGRKPEHWARISAWWDCIGDAFGVADYSKLWLKELGEPEAPGLEGLSVGAHKALLKDAGFEATECVWAYFGDAILMGSVALEDTVG